jgi:GNAT superfamily N-acetyltransferase
MSRQLIRRRWWKQTADQYKKADDTLHITFERATPADAQTLVNIQMAAFHHDSVIYPGVEMGGPPGYDSVEFALQKMREHDYYKILADGRIVGGIVVWTLEDGHFHLDLLYIDPDFHNHGIGKQAMQFIERTYPARQWTLDTPGYALRNQRFYEKFGYVKVAESIEEGGIILFVYEKRV